MNEIQRDNLILACFAVIVAIALLLIPNHHIPSVQTDYVTHTVKQGESISSIVTAENGFVSEKLARRAEVENGSSVIMPGQKLIIPVEIEGR